MDLTTFIIPSLNRPTLQRAIDSVKEYPYLVQIDHQNIGAGFTRQELIKQATTEWVSLLDDDDTVTEDYVQRLQEEIEGHPEADLIHFREYFVQTGELLPYWPNVTWGNVGVSFSVKRELALKYPFMSQPFEDYEFIRRLEDYGCNIFFSKYIVYRVRH